MSLWISQPLRLYRSQRIPALDEGTLYQYTYLRSEEVETREMRWDHATPVFLLADDAAWSIIHRKIAKCPMLTSTGIPLSREERLAEFALPTIEPRWSRFGWVLCMALLACISWWIRRRKNLNKSRSV